jgi:NAD(P)-dependent dehydrogenase (short-subunit alcohol dehydrogenase family)
VNNAGIAVAGPLMHVTPEELRRQFEVNVFGTLAVTQAFLPLLGARRDAPHPPGRIVNISSVSGHIAYPFMGPYAASKHALEAISDALRRELLLYGVDVIVVAPGSVSTPIWDKAEQQYGGHAPGTDYDEAGLKFLETASKLGREAMPVERVSRTVMLALETPKPKARYILSNNRLLGWLVPRWMPTRMYDRIIGARLGPTKKG